MLRAIPAPLALSLTLHAAALGLAVGSQSTVVVSTGGRQPAMAVSLLTLPLPVPAVAAIEPQRGELALPGAGSIARDGGAPARSAPSPARANDAAPAAAPDQRAARDSGAPDPAGVAIDTRPVPLTAIQWPQALMDKVGVRLRLRLTVDESGVPGAIEVIRVEGTMDVEPVLEAVRYARFIPAMAAGKPVPATIQVDLESFGQAEELAAR